MQTEPAPHSPGIPAAPTKAQAKAKAKIRSTTNKRQIATTPEQQAEIANGAEANQAQRAVEFAQMQKGLKELETLLFDLAIEKAAKALRLSQPPADDKVG